MTETGHQPYTQRSDWWSRRPRRSRSDSKVAGVAGGLGHYLGVDPILFRVAFVALTILGGAGVLAYALLWLLLPAEGDEVSAGESLIGRGRSSVSPWLAALLAVVIVVSITSSAAWGLPFWPAVIVAVIAFHIARKQRRGPFRPGSDWEQRFRSTQQAFTSNHWSGGGQQQQQQSGWGGQGRGWSGPGNWGNWGNWGGGCGSHQNRDQARDQAQQQSRPANAAQPAAPGFDDAPSPFDSPAFWDGPSSFGGTQQDAPTTGFPAPGGPGSTSAPGGPGSAPSAGGVNFVKGDSSGGSPSGSSGSPTAGPVDPSAHNRSGHNPSAQHPSNQHPSDQYPASLYPAPRDTPPAWDPLGAAPFAWDLPDIELAPQSGSTLVRQRSASPVIARATMGFAVLTVAAQILGMIAGWWVLGWAAIAGTALAIVALGLLVQAVRGRSITLVGPGVLLSVATVALALTGLAGTATVGERNWAPTAANLAPEYHLSIGDATLDLSGLELGEDETFTTSLEVGAGQARVVLPPDVNVNVECSANAGELECLGTPSDGLNQFVSAQKNDPKYTATINLKVHVGAGAVEVIG